MVPIWKLQICTGLIICPRDLTIQVGVLAFPATNHFSPFLMFKICWVARVLTHISETLQHGFLGMAFSRSVRTQCIVGHPRIMVGCHLASTQCLSSSGPRTLRFQTLMQSLACIVISPLMPLRTPTPRFLGPGVLQTRIATHLLLLYLRGLVGKMVLFHNSCSMFFTCLVVSSPTTFYWMFLFRLLDKILSIKSLGLTFI